MVDMLSFVDCNFNIYSDLQIAKINLFQDIGELVGVWTARYSSEWGWNYNILAHLWYKMVQVQFTRLPHLLKSAKKGGVGHHTQLHREITYSTKGKNDERLSNRTVFRGYVRKTLGELKLGISSTQRHASVSMQFNSMSVRWLVVETFFNVYPSNVVCKTCLMEPSSVVAGLQNSLKQSIGMGLKRVLIVCHCSGKKTHTHMLFNKSFLSKWPFFKQELDSFDIPKMLWVYDSLYLVPSPVSLPSASKLVIPNLCNTEI